MRIVLFLTLLPYQEKVAKTNIVLKSDSFLSTLIFSLLSMTEHP